MKTNSTKLILFFSLVFFIYPNSLLSQTPSDIFDLELNVKVRGVYTTEQIKAIRKHNKNTTVTYYDEMGRPIQKVQKNASFFGNDIVSFSIYDSLGRTPIEYMPFIAKNNNGNIIKNPVPLALKHHLNPPKNNKPNTHPYKQNVYSNRFPNSVVETGGFGKHWQIGSKYVTRKSYKDFNLTNPEILKFSADKYCNIKPDGTYKDIVLYHDTVYTDNGYTVSHSSISLEKTLREKTVFNNGDSFETHYIYNIYGQLCGVVPPEAEGEFDTSLIYRYKYYSYGKIEEHIPGSEPKYYVYDGRGRIVFEQDGNLRKKGKWLFMKYDKYDRPIITGLITDPSTREQLQNRLNKLRDDYTQRVKKDPRNKLLDSITPYFEHNDSTTEHGYSDFQFPSHTLENAEVLQVNYYDHYKNNKLPRLKNKFKVKFNPTANINPPYSETTIYGKMVGNKTKVLGENNMWIESIYYYDTYDLELNQTISTNHIGGYDVYSEERDYEGKLLGTEHINVRDNINKSEYSFYKKYKYYPNGNLHYIKEYIQNDKVYNGKMIQCPVKYKYNDNNQIIKIYRRSTTSSCMEYSDSTMLYYNDMGQLWKSENRFFSYELYYHNPPEANIKAGAKPNYKGNVSVMMWTNKQDKQKSYTLFYDQMGNLLEARYNPDNLYSAEYRYSKNGNIKQIIRNRPIKDKTTGIVYINKDTLNYYYKGNQITHIDGAPPFNKHTRENSSIPEFEYDANGNMTIDHNRSQLFFYNYLDLIDKIHSGSFFQNIVRNTYTSTGSRLRQTFQTGSGQIIKQIDYVGSMVFKDGKLSYVNSTAGIIEVEEYEFDRSIWQDYLWTYQYKDHLGSVRAVWRPKSPLGQERHSYPKPQEKISKGEDYYPFGLPHITPEGIEIETELPNNPNEELYKYGYQGKRFYTYGGILWQDFGSRYYDPTTGRWWSADPQKQFHSPYLAMGNNPFNGVDPDGELFIIDDWIIGGIKGLFNGDGFWKSANRHAQNSIDIWKGLFKGDYKQIISRFTWEFPQTMLGFTASHMTNTFKEVEEVDYFDGATIVTTTGKWGGISLGSFIIGDENLKQIKTIIF